MIQRIQTVYLLIVAILMGGVVWSPLAELTGEEVSYIFRSQGVYSTGVDSIGVMPAFPVLLVSVVTALIALGSIFLYKKRLLQIRFCIFNAVLLVGFYAAFFFYFWMAKDKLQVSLNVKYSLAFPLVSLVLDWLAIRSIRADEALVRSLNRIR